MQNHSPIQDIFKPIGESKHHIRDRRIMRARTRIMKNNMPVHQDIAVFVVQKVCSEIGGLTVHFEKAAFCPSNRRFYILDIYIVELRLCIEIDDPSHNGKEKRDEVRSAALLKDHEIIVARFRNDQIESLDFKEQVEAGIREVMEKRGEKKFEDRHLTRQPKKTKRHHRKSHYHQFQESHIGFKRYL